MNILSHNVELNFNVNILKFIGVFLLALTITIPTGVKAAMVGFSFDHNCAFIAGVCPPVGGLEYSVSIADVLPPSASAPLSFAGIAIEPLLAVPICPTIRYGGNGISSVPLSYTAIMSTVGQPCYGKNTFLDGNAAPMYFSTPSTPGTYSFCATGGMSNDEYMPDDYSLKCVSYQVSGVTTGSVAVTSNIASASWSITGPANHSGSGSSATYSNTPAGGYTIIWNDVAGYTRPANQSLTLAANGTIDFTGTYTVATPPSTPPAVDIQFIP